MGSASSRDLDIIEDLQYGIESGEDGYEVVYGVWWDMDVNEVSIGCPILKVKFNNNVYNAIVDTGSGGHIFQKKDIKNCMRTDGWKSCQWWSYAYITP